MNVKKEVLLPLPEVKRLLEERQKTSELTYTQRVTLEYVSKFSKVPAKKAIALVKELEKKYNLEAKLAVQITNSMPETIEELSTFFGGKTITYSKEEQKQILKTIKEFK